MGEVKYMLIGENGPHKDTVIERLKGLFIRRTKRSNGRQNGDGSLTTVSVILISISSALIILFLLQTVFSSSTTYQTSFQQAQAWPSSKKQPHIATYTSKSQMLTARETHTLKKICSNQTLLDRYTTYNMDTFWRQNLKPLLVERVSGTDGLLEVEAHIKKQLPDFYQVHMDIFKEKTPLKEVEFRNIIAYSNPNAERNLVIACHHDSKYWPKPNEVFIGATDSSVPCAMMLQLAQTLGEDVFKAKDVGLVLLFLDGEEAVVKWTRKDSVYGSRHLATRWSKEVTHADGRTALDKIDAFLLLDLLGAPKPKFHHDKKYQVVNQAFSRFAQIESHSKVKKLLRGNVDYFNEKSIGRYSLGIDDDHRPFVEAGCHRIIHLIPVPFPKVWHEITDNESALDRDTIHNLQVMLNIWTVEYLNLRDEL